MKNKNTAYVGVEEFCEDWGCSRSKGYAIIRQLSEQMHNENPKLLVIAGALGIYGLFMTILMIWKSAYIRKDLAAVPGMIGNRLLRAWSWLFRLAGDFAELADKIPIGWLAVILHWTLVILFIAIIIAIISAVVILAEKAFAWYRRWHNLKVAGVMLTCVLLLLLFTVEEIRYVVFCP